MTASNDLFVCDNLVEVSHNKSVFETEKPRFKVNGFLIAKVVAYRKWYGNNEIVNW